MKLKTKIFETWIDMPDGSRFLVRDLPSEKQKELVARNGGNPSGYVAEAYAYQIRDWQDVNEESGSSFPFSRENLLLAINHDLPGLNEVMEAFRKKLEAYRESLKSAEKNL